MLPRAIHRRRARSGRKPQETARTFHSADPVSRRHPARFSSGFETVSAAAEQWPIPKADSALRPDAWRCSCAFLAPPLISRTGPSIGLSSQFAADTLGVRVLATPSTRTTVAPASSPRGRPLSGRDRSWRHSPSGAASLASIQLSCAVSISASCPYNEASPASPDRAAARW